MLSHLAASDGPPARIWGEAVLAHTPGILYSSLDDTNLDDHILSSSMQMFVANDMTAIHCMKALEIQANIL